jgi:hypothetical protein
VKIVRKVTKINLFFYFKVCDCWVVDCLKLDGSTTVTSGTVADLLEKVCHVSPPKDVKEMLQLLMLDPTSQLQHYISCIQVKMDDRHSVI